jgi:hypothetical protein
MSRNYVSKMFVGTGIANITASPVDLAALTEGQIIAFDFDEANGADTSVSATTKLIGFARGTAVLGEPILAGPIPVAGIREALNNPYQAPVNQISTLTVTAVPAVGETAIFKVIYHDNLSIIPNQIKQTVVGVIATTANVVSTTTWATAIKAEFVKQTAELGGNLFVAVTSAAAVVTFTGITLKTSSSYNGIDRPETLVFEVGVPEATDTVSTYTVVDPATAAKAGQGDPAKIAWLEEQHMGRLGYADRRMWNDTKKYQSQLVAGITDYEVLVINADQFTEGDMQGTRANPIGAVIATSAAAMALIEVDLAFAGIVPEIVPANA